MCEWACSAQCNHTHTVSFDELNPGSISACKGIILLMNLVSGSAGKGIGTNVAVLSYLPVSLDVVWRRDPAVASSKSALRSSEVS
jgi:hypothetical protein